MKAKPKPTKADRPKKAKKSKPRRQVLEAQLEAICKKIVFQRDGMQCVERDIDGGRCGNGLQWGHFIPRSQSKWLKYDLGNTFCQCGSHNYLHDRGAVTMSVWFTDFFGQYAAAQMDKSARLHTGANGNRSIIELEEMLEKYQVLLDDITWAATTRYAAIQNGYYGDIIKESA